VLNLARKEWSREERVLLLECLEALLVNILGVDDLLWPVGWKCWHSHGSYRYRWKEGGNSSEESKSL
jgi:hypothetical protein